MSTRVWRAFRHAGRRKAGTPFEMASTPVTAAPPEAKACRTTNTLAPMSSPWPPSLPNSIIPSSGCPTARRSPVKNRVRPTPSSTTMLSMKK